VSTDPATACVVRAMRLLLKETKAAARSEEKAQRGREESFENGKLQALSFALLLLATEVEKADLGGPAGKLALESKAVIEDLGMGDFGLR
jgi:hypothetical protein